ncbi:hypothetical protein [Caballeronia cordobensis]|nr:hypothetical protein [Caballeronia cordobensis]
MIKALGTIVLLSATGWGLYAWLTPPDEVVLTLGEPYEQVRERSRSTLPPAEKNTNWAGVVSRPTRLRLVAYEKVLVTPPSMFLAVTYDSRGRVDGVRLSPQVEPLPLDETLKIVRNLQDQLRRGWTPFRSRQSQPIRDDVATRDAIRNCDDPTSRWNSGPELQIAIDIRCFKADTRPDDERYLITLILSRPWVDDRPESDR